MPDVPEGSADLGPAMYELIGRIITTTAVLEARLIEIAIRLAWQTDGSKAYEDLGQAYGGLGGKELRTTVQELADLVDLDHEAFTAFTARVAERQEERNHVAHNVWLDAALPTDTGSAAFVTFRTLRKLKRDKGDKAPEFQILHRGRLEDDLELVTQVDKEAVSWMWKFPVPPFRDDNTP